MKDFFKNTITLNVLFCISYFLLATLGFQWGALTANATLLWPPSGLAVFACLVFGHRVIPGLLLGAIISSQSISLANLDGNSAVSYLIGAVNGSSSILQAFVIASLSKTYYSQDFRVTTRAAFYFTIKVLAGCTIAATISNLMLWQVDVVRSAVAIQNWVVWWTGDVIGVLIITPLLLWIHNRKAIFQQSQENAFFIFSVGVGIVFLATAAVGHKERETFKSNLAHATDILHIEIQSKIDLATRDLSNLQDFLVHKNPDKNAFQSVTEPLLKRNPSLDSFSWIALERPHASSNYSVALENSWTLTRSNNDSFLLQTVNPDRFSNPFIASLAQPSKNHKDIFFTSSGIYQKDPVIPLAAYLDFCNDQKSSECTSRHFIVAHLNLNFLMEAVTTTTSLKGIQIQLGFKNGKNEIAYLQWNKNQWVDLKNPDEIIKNPVSTSGKTLPLIKVTNNEWQLLVGANSVSSQLVPSFMQCSILLIGLSLVVLLSAYLQSLYRQDQLVIENQERLKEEIETQTEALRAANDWLLKEIAEKRTTQEQLKASEAHMRTLLDNIPDPVWFKSPAGAYISFNKAVTELFYRKEKDVIGKKAGDYVDAELENAIKDFESTVLTSRDAIRRELWMHIPSKNEHRLMDTIKVAMRDQQDHPTGILSIARDITEQRKLIDELEKFKRFAEFASEGFSIMSLGAETLYMNRSMQRMLVSNQTVSHNNFLNYFPEDLHEQWRENIFPYVLLKGYWQGELAALRADGYRFPTKATFFAIRDDKGQPLYIGEIMSDISEQKQIEASLQLAKQAAEEATRAKSRFLANMSHEIRTPLNAVLGYSQLLMTDTQLSAQQQERMQSILSAGQRLLHLINDILDLSKIEAGVLHFRQDYFDLHQELNDIVAIMRTKAISKGLALNYDIQLPIPAIVKSDRQKIGQIILNLMGNAIKFTHSGEINLVVQVDEKAIGITITDTGPGISAQELQSLFSAFKQGKAGEESGGTGLGLVISKHIAESLGGDITLNSDPGKGTRAHLSLPLTIEYNASVERAPVVVNAKLAEGEKCFALVVEDDPASRDLLVNLLREMGCDVKETMNGREGLATALTQKPDIIFTDIRMPELTGTEMLQELRKTFSKESLPVVAVSASSLEHERTFYLNEGFHEFIGKPYEFGDIYSALQKLTGVKFASSENNEKIQDTQETERTCWQNPDELTALKGQLLELKQSLNSGDMNSSKKLFNSQSAQTLGKTSHQKINNAIRQYDLVLAEKFLDELLTEISTVMTNA